MTVLYAMPARSGGAARDNQGTTMLAMVWSGFNRVYVLLLYEPLVPGVPGSFWLQRRQGEFALRSEERRV